MYKYVYICYRARQSEIKKEQEKEQLELDPGNPNWQFLKMIRYLIFSSVGVKRKNNQRSIDVTEYSKNEYTK